MDLLVMRRGLKEKEKSSAGLLPSNSHPAWSLTRGPPPDWALTEPARTHVTLATGPYLSASENKPKRPRARAGDRTRVAVRQDACEQITLTI